MSISYIHSTQPNSLPFVSTDVLSFSMPRRSQIWWFIKLCSSTSTMNYRCCFVVLELGGSNSIVLRPPWVVPDPHAKSLCHWGVANDIPIKKNIVRVPPLYVVSKVPVRVHYLQLPIDIKCVVLGTLYCAYSSVVLLHPFWLHFMSFQVHFILVFESGSWVIILFWSLIWCIMSRVSHRSISLTLHDRNTLQTPCYSLISHRWLSLYQSSL